MTVLPALAWPTVRAAAGDPAALARLLGRPDPDGLTAVTNDRWSVQRIQTSLPPHRLWREISPEAGRFWGPVVTAEPRTVHVLEAVARDDVPRDSLICTTGRLTPDGTAIGARGLPGSIVRAFGPSAAGEPAERVVVFAEDGLISEIGGSRYRINMWAGLTVEGDELVLERDWVPGRPAYGLARWDAVVDVPATAKVRVLVDGTEVPVRRRYAPAGAEPQPARVEEWMCSFVADLTPLRAARPDPDLPWRLQVRMRGVDRADYGGVHLAGTQRRRTEACTLIAPPRWDLQRRAVDSGGGGEVGTGQTIGDFVVANRDRPAPPGTAYLPDVRYAPDRAPSLVASVHRNTDAANPSSAVLLVHGGGWREGDRGSRLRCADALAARGYVTVNIEYRHHPEVGWRDSVDDVRAALRWIRGHADELGADPDRVAVVGESAGAHLAAMAAVADACDAQGADHAALVLFYPPVDLPAVLSAWGPAFGDLAAEYFGGEPATASPSAQVGPHWPPVLTLIGDADPLIALDPVRAFHTALQDAGVANRLVVYPGRAHGFDLFERSGFERSTAELIDFLAANLA